MLAFLGRRGQGRLTMGGWLPVICVSFHLQSRREAQLLGVVGLMFTWMAVARGYQPKRLWCCYVSQIFPAPSLQHATGPNLKIWGCLVSCFFFARPFNGGGPRLWARYFLWLRATPPTRTLEESRIRRQKTTPFADSLLVLAAPGRIPHSCSTYV